MLALVAFRYGKPELGVRLLNNIAATTERGTLGNILAAADPTTGKQVDIRPIERLPHLA